MSRNLVLSSVRMLRYWSRYLAASLPWPCCLATCLATSPWETAGPPSFSRDETTWPAASSYIRITAAATMVWFLSTSVIFSRQIK